MATASCPAPVKQMETLLECSVCMEILTQPRTLSCYHSFCKHCLENYVAAQRKKAVKAKASVPEIFECPLCRTKFSVKEGENVGEKMPANHFINNLLELLSIQQQAYHVKCQSCKANAPAASRCISCEKFLCGKCLETHNNWTDFDDHVVLTLEELAKPENRAKAKDKPRCEKHSKIIKFYCETCKVRICRYCMDLNHTRPEHTWFPLADVVVQHKDALNAFAGIFQKQNNDAAESNRKIQEAIEDLKYNTAKAKFTIKQQQQNILDAFAEKLGKETTALLGKVDMIFAEANEALLKQQADVKAYFEKAKSSLAFARNILTSGNDEEMLALKQEIEEKAGSIVKERPEIMEPVHDGPLEYHPKPTKGVIENMKLNDLGKIVFRTWKETRLRDPDVQFLCERSTILEGNLEHAKQLVEWVKDYKFGWQLCYRASRDGWEGWNFHGRCDDVGPTLTLVKCGTNVFGGFTDQSWKNHPQRVFGLELKHSVSSFLFSLKNKENIEAFKCPIKDGRNDKAIVCHPHCGAIFGGGNDLFISHEANTNRHSYSNFGETYQPPPGFEPGTPQTNALLAGSSEFTPCEIEVFHS
ncbi:E3 ubiquitin-protein ligase TRIM33-like isoform X2 [Dendronephthya gigantea]|uniref:E3 ubiquitin-protein ligase TRIM33-like isoform X2 n=1 Tax=Dendronephthya gigantea TaxID=151771 RepID=UPI001069F9BA|nr:E3 ubiquitin-protein ligase TRIM33-like isoform X2 [Dendronephthya gigantea]